MTWPPVPSCPAALRAVPRGLASRAGRGVPVRPAAVLARGVVEAARASGGGGGLDLVSTRVVPPCSYMTLCRTGITETVRLYSPL